MFGDQSTNTIEVKNLTYILNKQIILENVDFNVSQGEYIGLLGPNGGGKTTLIKLILGILKPTSGSIKLFNGEYKNPRGKVGYVPQRVNSGGLDFPATVEEVVSSGLTMRSNFRELAATASQKIQKALQIAQIEDLQHKPLSDLSGGQRQKVFIARSLVDEPKILILDEPTVAIDVQSQLNFYSFIKTLNQELQITIILISHDISAIAQEVDKIFFLDQKLSCYHSSTEFLHPENIEKLYGTNINLISHHH